MLQPGAGKHTVKRDLNCAALGLFRRLCALLEGAYGRTRKHHHRNLRPVVIFCDKLVLFYNGAHIDQVQVAPAVRIRSANTITDLAGSGKTPEKAKASEAETCGRFFGSGGTS
jgi:hypothetical protein